MAQVASRAAQLQSPHGARLRVSAAAPFTAARRPCQRRERQAHSGKCRAVYVTEQEAPIRRSPVWDGPTATVTFKIQRQLPFGQALKLVGSHAALGEWDVALAPAMTWSEGDVWQLALPLPAGEHEYKVAAVVAGAGKEEVVAAEWEAGPNRVLQVPLAEAKIGGAFSVALEWGNAAAAWLEGQDGAWGSEGEGQRAHWTIEDEREARRLAEAEREQLRGERDALARQLRATQEQLEAALAEKAQLEAAAARAQHNIDVLRNVGALLRTMHTD